MECSETGYVSPPGRAPAKTRGVRNTVFVIIVLTMDFTSKERGYDDVRTNWLARTRKFWQVYMGTSKPNHAKNAVDWYGNEP